VKVVAIIQARMGSTRLPGKVLTDIGGKTMLARVVRRTQQASLLNHVLVATTVKPADEAIVNECAQLNVPIFRGSEEDVLDRYYQAAQAHHADAIVRITSDCPLIDPRVLDRVVDAFLNAHPDYASNTLERTYPRGLDTEVIASDALEHAWHQATERYQRVHVTPFLYENPSLFHLLSVTGSEERSNYRWTVDTLEDLSFVKQVYNRFDNDDTVGWRDILALLNEDPNLAKLNRSVLHKALRDG
jgi:spore coat polysaccharide biosynthesis protein SpsF